MTENSLEGKATIDKAAREWPCLKLLPPTESFRTFLFQEQVWLTQCQSSPDIDLRVPLASGSIAGDCACLNCPNGAKEGIMILEDVNVMAGAHDKWHFPSNPMRDQDSERETCLQAIGRSLQSRPDLITLCHSCTLDCLQPMHLLLGLLDMRDHDTKRRYCWDMDFWCNTLLGCEPTSLSEGTEAKRQRDR